MTDPTPSTARLTDEQQKALYWSLLRGVAKVAQDQLCAADKHHDWGGRVVRYVVQKDGPPPAPIQSGPPIAMNEGVQIAGRQTCLNCGKERLS